MKILLLLLFSLLSFGAQEEEPIDKLDMTDLDQNLSTSDDIVYSVQERLVPLKNRLEFGILTAGHFKSESYVDSLSSGAFINYHFSSRFALGLEGRYYFNQLSDAGSSLINQNLIVPEIVFPKYSGALLAYVNLFYGKIRFSFDNTIHYDQYWFLGPSYTALNTQNAIGVSLGGGFAFWINQFFDLRLQLADYYHREKRTLGIRDVHDFVGQINLGFLLG